MKWKKDKTSAESTAQTDSGAVDEALFNALNKAKKRKRRKRIRIIVILLILLGVGGFFGTRLLQKKVQTQFASSKEDVLSAAAERGSISTLVSGSGMLVNVDTQVVSVPAGVEVTEILVKYGDTVEEGSLLATVDMASVRTAMSTLQENIEALDKQIASAKGDTVSSYITAKVSGRVKAVYAGNGDLVEDVMVDHGCLALLSLDGYMMAEIRTDALTAAEKVTVIRPDGSEMTGSVDSVTAGRAVILLSDDGPAVGEEVTIRSAAGNTLGTASLTVHNPMAITGYAGKISYVGIQENQLVYTYSSLFTLTDTGTTANYDSLLRTRSEYEATLLELLQIQRNNAVVSPIAGSVYSAATLSSDSTDTITDIVTLSPDLKMEVSIKVSESDILSLQTGQKAAITVNSLSDTTLDGTVTEIDRSYASGYYTALVTLDKIQGMIPGMTASVDIRIEGVDDAILIPKDALHQTANGYYVYTAYDEETQEYGGRTEVVPGLSNSKQVEIRSGLREGDTVYYTESQSFTMPFGNSGFGGGMPGSGNSGNSGFSGFGGNSGNSGFSGGSGNSGFGGGNGSGSSRPSSSGSADGSRGGSTSGNRSSGGFGG